MTEMTPNKRATEKSVEPAPEGLERLAMEDFINRLSRSSDSKLVLCRITEIYARNRWPLPQKLSDWIAEIMSATFEGRIPFPRPRGKRANYLTMVVFVRKLEKKGEQLGTAKERAGQKFGVSRQIINLALRTYEIDPSILDTL